MYLCAFFTEQENPVDRRSSQYRPYKVQGMGPVAVLDAPQPGAGAEGELRLSARY